MRSIALEKTKKCFHSTNLMSGLNIRKLIHILPLVNSMSSCCSRVLNKKKAFHIYPLETYGVFFLFFISKTICPTYSHRSRIFSWYSYFSKYLSHPTYSHWPRIVFSWYSYFSNSYPTHSHWRITVFSFSFILLSIRCFLAIII